MSPLLRRRWTHLCDPNPLSLLLSSFSLSFTPVCVFDLSAFHYMNNSFICHSCTHISVSKCVFATFLLPCFACRRVPTLCACPSHTSRSVHLYVSETSLEIDSSDGMISDASTKDSSSSEEEGPSSDDEDDGDDSDWGRVDYDNNNNNNNTEVKPDRKPAREMPTWPLWVKIQDSAERRQHEECTSAAAAALSEATVSESELKKKERRLSFSVCRKEEYVWSNAFEIDQSLETELRVPRHAFERVEKIFLRNAASVQQGLWS